MKKQLLKYSAFISLLFISFCFPNLGCGQEPPLLDDFRTNPVSPQVWSFMVYGDHPLDLHTGTVGVSIPIYMYQDRDFELPISLNYSSNGFKPNKQADIVGYDWYLKVGGVITREKRGMRDETQEMGNHRGYMYYHNLTGILALPLQTRQISQETRPELWQVQEDVANNKKIYYEMEPDIFHFNFMGYQGSFQLGPNGQFYVYNANYPNGEFKIKEFRLTSDNVLSIIIITGDGYEYTFGGNKYCVDYLDSSEEYLELGPEDYNKIGQSAIPRAWHLAKVTAPNKRTVIFDYDRRRNIISQFTPKYFRNLSDDEGAMWNTDLSYTNSAQLKAVIIGDWRAHFTYRKREPEEYEKASNVGTIFSSDLLTSITIISTRQNKILRASNLSYTRAPKMLLERVDFMGESGHLDNSYLMKYYGDVRVPVINTFAIDHWGYWNDRATNMTFIPMAGWSVGAGVTSEESNPDIIFSIMRNPVYSKAVWGMLSDIQYPTGGYSHFEYESHDYAHVLKHCPTRNTFYNDYAPVLIEEPGVAGGVRIRSIQNHDNLTNALLSTKKYIYNYSYQDNADYNRTGILLKHPRYGLSITYQIGNSRTTKRFLRSNWDPFSFDKSDVEYRSVFELLDDGTSVEYEFSTHMTDCDNTEYETYAEFMPAGFSYIFVADECRNGVHNLLKKPNSRHNERGKLLGKIVRDQNSELVQREQMFYTHKDLQYVESPMYTSVDGCYRHEEYIDNYTLDSIVYQSKYKPTICLAYKYNTRKQQIKQISYESDGSIISTYTTYFLDKYNRTAAEQSMIENNIVRYPYVTYKTHNKTGTEYLIDFRKNNFVLYDNLPKLQSVGLGHIYENSLPPINISSYPCYREILYWNYDKYGNVTQSFDKAMTPTCYLWSDDGLRLEAVLVNTTLTAVEETCSITGDLTSAQERMLRTIPGALVTTYKHIPYIGICEITDPRGYKTSYSYTPYGRLKAEYDNFGHTVHKYFYGLNSMSAPESIE